MSTLLHSRKFWLAVVAVIQSVILHFYNIDPVIWQSIDALIGVLIASIAIEDAGAKIGAG
jgi:hypothetical protein